MKSIETNRTKNLRDIFMLLFRLFEIQEQERNVELDSPKKLVHVAKLH